jgi:hypothetical protein
MFKYFAGRVLTAVQAAKPLVKNVVKTLFVEEINPACEVWAVRPLPSSYSKVNSRMKGYPSPIEEFDQSKVLPYDHPKFVNPMEAIKDIPFLDAEQSLMEQPIEVRKYVSAKRMEDIVKKNRVTGYVTPGKFDSGEEAHHGAQMPCDRIEDLIKYEITTVIFPSQLHIPLSHGGTGKWFEPKAAAYPGHGEGGGKQFVIPAPPRASSTPPPTPPASPAPRGDDTSGQGTGATADTSPADQGTHIPTPKPY